jgi:hypothetical protein
LPRVLQAKSAQQAVTKTGSNRVYKIKQPLPQAAPAARHGRPVVQRSCLSGVWSFISSCWNSSGTQYARVPMDESVSRLPPWGTAVSLGLHKTSKWSEIQSSGQFLEGGGQLGQGIYIVKSDYSWVSSTYPALNVLLEVGYVGDTSRWVVLEVNNVLEYKRMENVEGQYDVVKTKHDSGPLNQVCYKLNGPNNIQLANFRVRRAS